MIAVSCAALRDGDAAGAALAIDKGLDLELSARPPSTDIFELALPVRSVLAGLLHTRAALRSAEGDEVVAREAALEARRLNITSSVSSRKLPQATSRLQRAAPHDVLGLSADEVRPLQAWFDALLPLDQEEHGRPVRHESASDIGLERIDALRGAQGGDGAPQSTGEAESVAGRAKRKSKATRRRTRV